MWNALIDAWNALFPYIANLYDVFTTPLIRLLSCVEKPGYHGGYALSPVLSFLENYIGDWSLLYLMVIGFATFIIPFTVIKWVLDIVP